MGSIILLVEHSIALWSKLYFSTGLSNNSLGCTSFVVQSFFAVIPRCLRLLLMAFGTAKDLYLGQKF